MQYIPVSKRARLQSPYECDLCKKSITYDPFTTRYNDKWHFTCNECFKLKDKYWNEYHKREVK